MMFCRVSHTLSTFYICTKVETGRACVMNGGEQECIQGFGWKAGRGHYEELATCKRIILK
jgi:hypothetical protein